MSIFCIIFNEFLNFKKKGNSKEKKVLAKLFEKLKVLDFRKEGEEFTEKKEKFKLKEDMAKIMNLSEEMSELKLR